MKTGGRSSKTKLKKLAIQLELPSREDYDERRAKYIAEYKGWEGGGFLSVGHEVPRPDIGEAEWNGMYPHGFDSWAMSHGHVLNSFGQQTVIDKINEIIKYLNKERP